VAAPTAPEKEFDAERPQVDVSKDQGLMPEPAAKPAAEPKPPAVKHAVQAAPPFVGGHPGMSRTAFASSASETWL
jgi:hypothetical protein